MIARLLLATLGLVSSIAPGGVAAHRLLRPKADHLFVQPARVLLVLTYQIAPGPDARFVRGVFDSDRDGVLSEREQERITDFLVRTAVLRLSVAINGATVELRRLAAVTRGVRLPSRSAASLGVRALFGADAAWRIGPNRLELRDRHSDRAIPVVGTLHLGPPFELQWTSLGRWDPGSRRILQVEMRAGTAWEILFRAPEVIP